MQMTPTRLEIRDMIDTAALAEQDFSGTLTAIKQKVTDYQNIYEGYRSNILERLERFKDIDPETVLYLFTRSDITLLMRAWRVLNSMLYSLSIKGWALPDESFLNNQTLADIGLQYKSIFGSYEDESISNRFGRYFLITSNTYKVPKIKIPFKSNIGTDPSQYVDQYLYRAYDIDVFTPKPLCWHQYITDAPKVWFKTMYFDLTTKTYIPTLSGEIHLDSENWPDYGDHCFDAVNCAVTNATDLFWLPEFSKIVFTEGVDPVYKENCGYYRYGYADDDPHHTAGMHYIRLNIFSVQDIINAHEKYGDIYTRNFRPGVYYYDPKYSWYDSLKNNTKITMELNPRKLWKGYWGSGKFGWSSVVDDLLVKKSYRDSGWDKAAYELAADAAFLIHNYNIDHKVDITQLFTLLQEQEQCKALFQIGNIWAVRHQIVRIVCTQLMKLYKNGRIGRLS